MISEPALNRLSAMLHGPDVSGTRYEIVSELGRGGMGVVYLARDTVLDREVALKVVDASAADFTVEKEARILARLEHPGLVPIHDFGQLPDGRLFYAMKRVRGDRLDRWVAGGRDLTARLGVFLRICDAVAFAHAHGVIHRDLKPANVMVGEFGEVLVLDWGIAAAKGDRDLSAAVVGTRDFMPPEQMRADAHLDERADVYALGAILAATAPDTAALVAVADKARSDDPAARYPSVPALAADVSRFLAGLAVEAHRESLIDRITRVGRRYRLPMLLVLAYLLMRVLLLWASRAAG
jgi:serine/threonine protein kinase